MVIMQKPCNVPENFAWIPAQPPAVTMSDNIARRAVDTVRNSSAKRRCAKGFQLNSAVKICYRYQVHREALAQNDSAVGSVDQPLTHRIPVTFNGDRLFRGRTA